MAGVEVGLEGLMVVREALVTFQQDITGLGTRAAHGAAQLEQQAQNALGSTRRTIEVLEEEIQELEEKIRLLEAEIAQLYSGIGTIDAQLLDVQDRIEGLYAQLSQLENKRVEVNGRLSGAQEEQRAALQDVLARVNSAIAACQNQMTAMEERERSRLHAELVKARGAKDDLEQQHAVQKRRHAQYMQKYVWLQASYERLCNELAAYTSLAARFERGAVEAAGRNETGLARCIDGITGYLETHI